MLVGTVRVGSFFTYPNLHIHLICLSPMPHYKSLLLIWNPLGSTWLPFAIMYNNQQLRNESQSILHLKSQFACYSCPWRSHWAETSLMDGGGYGARLHWATVSQRISHIRYSYYTATTGGILLSSDLAVWLWTGWYSKPCTAQYCNGLGQLHGRQPGIE